MENRKKHRLFLNFVLAIEVTYFLSLPLLELVEHSPGSYTSPANNILVIFIFLQNDRYHQSH